MKRVLIDTKLFRELNLGPSLLHRSDIDMLTAASAAELMDAHRERPADIIVLDAVQPDASGDALTRLMKDRGNPAVMLVCPNDPENLQRCHQSGADVIIPRPVEKIWLLNQIGQLLGVPQRRAVRVPVHVRVAGRRGTDEFFAESIDISMTGLLIAVTPPHTFTADQTVTLDFVLPGQHERVATDARIVRDAGIAGRNHRYGVVFVEMSRQARSLIQSYVETQLY